MNMVPMLRPVLFLGAGILAGRYLSFTTAFWLVVMVLMLFGALLLRVRNNGNVRSIAFQGVFLMLAISCGGAALYVVGKSTPISTSTTQVPLEIKVTKVLKSGPSQARLLGVVQKAQGQDELPGRRLLVMLDKPRRQLLPGDRIVAVGKVQPIPAAPNPGQFSLANYYGHKWIYGQTWLQEGTYSIRSPRFSMDPFRYSHWVSIQVRNAIKRYLPERTAPLMQAMLLGIKHDVSEEMLSTYQQAGVMHILAVSGMHVGIIYLGLLLLFGPLIRRRPSWWWLPVMGIWLFAFITGAGPAVVRASLMLTLVDMGKRTGDAAHPFNLLMASAFVLLILQPYLLWDIGFQLSYAAMAGILWFMKPISTMVWFRHRYIHSYFWQPIALSISAQMATMPLVLHYFGVFPTVFIFSNIITLLPVLLGLWGAVLMVTAHFLLPEVVATFLGKALDLLLHHGFNVPLQWLAGLPGAYLSHIYMDPIQVLLWLTGIFFLAIWLQQFRSGKWLIMALSSFLGVILVGNVRSWLEAASLQPVLLYAKGHTVVMAPVSHHKAYMWTDAALMSDINAAGFDLNGTRHRYGWRHLTYLDTSTAIADDTLLVVGGKSVLHLNQSLKGFSTGHPVDVNYLIPGEKLYLDTALVRRIFPNARLVLDGSLTGKKRHIFKRLLHHAGIPHHDIREDGFIGWE